MLQALLIHLGDGDGWDTAIDGPVDEKVVAAATQPLTEAGWKYTLTGHGIRWTSPDGQAGVRFDPLTAQHHQNPASWTIWAGPDPDRPTWAITASPHTPSSLLADLTKNLAHGIGTRKMPTTSQRNSTLATVPPGLPRVYNHQAVSRSL
ncbi:DUF317 domain-containing protein [Streptomyces sp. Ag82_G6-1]|uniref:DUF317 domain-containing protein n=1 Tax=Streptomyces sp. Ag82_G6-1 TaxID=1938853 RepID=UPI00359C461B